MAFLPVDEQMKVLLRGCEALYTEQELRAKIERSCKAGKPLRIKLGLDPSSPDIHVGHSVVLRKLRQFQDLGHKAVLIVGDYTAMIGDPTGKNKTRPMLTPKQVEANAQTYFSQAGKILKMDPDAIEVTRNSDWLGKMNLSDALKMASRMTVARMLERDTFEKRYKAGVEIYLHEFMYPLLQGTDSVAIHSDLELGGTDQTFNNLAGRDLQKDAGQDPQCVMIMPILTGLDGTQKMSKSLGNYIGLTDSPKDMFGKTMSIPDTLMKQWFTLLTARPAEEIAALCDGDKTHPRKAKEVLGKEIVATYYGQAAADQEAEQFIKVFKEGQVRADIPEVKVSAAQLQDGKIWIAKLLQVVGFAPSTSEGRRLVQGGGVTIDEQKITDVSAQIEIRGQMVLQVGKRRVAKVVID
jgi:tyrosyl-tRNA synthetase